jgi:hypothetical protein
VPAGKTKAVEEKTIQPRVPVMAFVNNPFTGYAHDM